jgi:hypothetical protein
MGLSKYFEELNKIPFEVRNTKAFDSGKTAALWKRKALTNPYVRAKEMYAWDVGFGFAEAVLNGKMSGE